jgi:hypothetical protein
MNTLSSAEVRIIVGRDAETNTCKDGANLECLYTLLLLLTQTIKNSSAICIGLRWEVSFALWTACSYYILNRRLGVSLSRFGCFGDEISMFPVRNRTTMPRKPSHFTGFTIRSVKWNVLALCQRLYPYLLRVNNRTGLKVYFLAHKLHSAFSMQR